MRKSNPPMVFTEGTEAAAKAASAPIVGLRFRLAIPWRVALLQSSLPLRQPAISLPPLYSVCRVILSQRSTVPFPCVPLKGFTPPHRSALQARPLPAYADSELCKSFPDHLRSFCNRDPAASNVSRFLAKQNRISWEPLTGSEKKLDPGTAATPISSTRLRASVTSSL
jgi:hypothetical protein